MSAEESSPLTLAAALSAARSRLAARGEGDAAILLCHLLGVSRAWLHAWPERVLTAAEHAAFESLVARRAAGEPVAYITGRREFWSLDLAVTSATLIPRPDTETLVAQALAHIPADARWAIADLGTGSGAVALAIAHDRPRCHVVASDLSADALAVATANARRLRIDNTRFVAGSWLEPLAGQRFQMIVSNPPYIPEGDHHLDEGDLPFEPRAALVAPEHGLADLRHIIAGAPAHLDPGGWLLLEHGYDQGSAVRHMMAAAGFEGVETSPDLGERDRVTAGQLPGTHA